MRDVVPRATGVVIGVLLGVAMGAGFGFVLGVLPGFGSQAGMAFGAVAGLAVGFGTGLSVDVLTDTDPARILLVAVAVGTLGGVAAGGVVGWMGETALSDALFIGGLGGVSLGGLIGVSYVAIRPREPANATTDPQSNP